MKGEEEKGGDIILLRTHICSYESAQGPLAVCHQLLACKDFFCTQALSTFGAHCPIKRCLFFPSTHRRIVKPLARLCTLALVQRLRVLRRTKSSKFAAGKCLYQVKKSTSANLYQRQVLRGEDSSLVLNFR